MVIITGANTGIGKETARDLARRGKSAAFISRHPCAETERAGLAVDPARDLREEYFVLTFKSTGVQRYFNEPKCCSSRGCNN